MSSSDNLQSWIATVKLGKFLPEADLIKLCEIVKGKLLEEPNIRPVSSPVTVCGDLHGQFYDVLELFKQGGDVERTKYIFLGDYVDRGYFSLETFTLLMLLKALHPDRVTLLRGNHESRTITQVYGFYDECQQKYASANAWKHCTQVFDFLTIAALIDDRIFCVHGGLSPDVKTLDHIRTISRNQEIPQDGAFCDLVWSDPEEAMAESYRVSPRGAGYVFGKSATTQFLHKNNLDKICRAHQLVQEGYTKCHGDKVITVWSAPNYCYRCGNRAAIMEYNGGESFKQYDAVPNDQRVSLPQSATLNYFL